MNEMIADLSFHVPMAADMRAMGARPINGNVLPIQPNIQGANSSARQVESGNYNFTYDFPAPGAWGKGWAIAEVTSASIAPAASGDASTYVSKNIVPLTQRWASDSTLDTQYQKIPNLGAVRAGTETPYDPSLVKDANAILKNVGWPLAYLSNVQHDVLVFYQSGLVVHLRFEQRHYASDSVPVDQARAVALHDAAMRDSSSHSEEADTGHDFFLGTPYEGAFPPPKYNDWDNLEPAYDFPASTTWNATFVDDFARKPYWLVDARSGGGFGVGMVDALTGAEIRFTRPNKNYSTNPDGPAPSAFPQPPGSHLPTAPGPLSSP